MQFGIGSLGVKHRMRRIKSLLPLLLVVAALLQACVYVPRTREFYDADCQIVAKRMVLTQKQLGTIGQCTNEGCIRALVGLGIISSASIVVSGSIVIAGNVIYWFEKQGECRKRTMPARTQGRSPKLNAEAEWS